MLPLPSLSCARAEVADGPPGQAGQGDGFGGLGEAGVNVVGYARVYRFWSVKASASCRLMAAPSARACS
jgi:hypothetical protein